MANTKKNYTKLTKSEQNSKENRVHKDRYYEELQENAMKRTKTEMARRWEEYLLTKDWTILQKDLK